MICKSRKSKGIIRDNVTEKRFFTKKNRIKSKNKRIWVFSLTVREFGFEWHRTA